MTAPLPAPFGPAGQDDAAAREALHERLDEWNTAHLRLALQAVIPALTPGQVFTLATVLGLCDRWAGDIAGRVPAVAPDGPICGGCGECGRCSVQCPICYGDGTVPCHDWIECTRPRHINVGPEQECVCAKCGGSGWVLAIAEVR